MLSIELTIKDILSQADISRKQVNNRINKIKQYNKLVTGGGKGKGGRYLINSVFYNYLILSKKVKHHNKLIRNVSESQTSYPISLYEEIFNQIDWSYFGCYSPPKIYDIDELIEILPISDGELLFYSVHNRLRTDELHIHFVVATQVDVKRYKKPQMNLSLEVKPFNSNLSGECFSYFITPKENQFAVEYGFILGVKNHNHIQKIKLV
jgi:hypothetical protein